MEDRVTFRMNSKKVCDKTLDLLDKNGGRKEAKDWYSLPSDKADLAKKLDGRGFPKRKQIRKQKRDGTGQDED